MMASEKRLIDEGEKTKIKTPMARIMVSGTVQNPYFDILYFNPSDKKFHVGFGSFSLEYVFKWLSEEFEIIDEYPTVDAVEVVHGRWEKASEKMPIYRCSICKERNLFKNGYNVLSNFCPNCGAKMDGERKDNG